jgi:hypothetical protein
MDQGYFEYSMTAAVVLVLALTLNVRQLHPDVELHFIAIFNRIFKRPTDAEVLQGLYKWGFQITLLILVDCLPTAAQDECLLKQLLECLGMSHSGAQGRKQWSEKERSGINFMFCASTLTPEYSNNYPSAMLRPSVGQTTVITNLRSGMCLGSVVRQLQWSEEVPIKDILSVFIKRSFSNDDKGCIRPTRTSNGSLIEGSTDTCIIKWLPGKTPGRVADRTLKSLVELSRGGAALGAHEPFHEVEPWVIQMRQLNTVINANLKLKGTPQKFTAEAPKAKAGDKEQATIATTDASLGLLKLRPWNKEGTPVASEEVSSPGSFRHILSDMELTSQHAIHESMQAHNAEVASTPSSRYIPSALKGTPVQVTLSTMQTPLTNRASFAYSGNSNRGTLVRAEAPAEQMTLAKVESLLARAEQARDREMQELRLQMNTMQQNNQLQIAASVGAAMESAFNSDVFAEKMVRAMYNANLQMQKESLSAQYAPANDQGPHSSQTDHR